jgi:hypothetical protein
MLWVVLYLMSLAFVGGLGLFGLASLLGLVGLDAYRRIFGSLA